MSRVVAALEEQGYVERTADPEDGRAKLLSATPEGIELIRNARTRKARLLSEVMDELAPTTGPR